VVIQLYETKDTGLNHYQLLQVNRATTTNELKKAYRHISRELHPDRNHAPTAAEDFNRVKHAFDILVNPETRSLYDRLGESVAKASTQTVIDHKYIIIQMFVYYCSSSILAFFMTFSEHSGEALSASFFAMAGNNSITLLFYYYYCYNATTTTTTITAIIQLLLL
jgi:DnaJ-class molecular chaperone